MKINACIIVKDDSELDKLHKAVCSIFPYVDGIYITANGEKTSKIENYCNTAKCSEEGKILHYSYFKWCDDFSAVRNFNFSQVPADTDYIFWMDTDDILVGGENLREIATMAKQTNKDVVFFTYWYGCKFKGEPTEQNLVDVELEHMRERLIRPGTIEWKGRLHETPVPVNGSRHTYTQHPYKPDFLPIAVMHTATDFELPEKMERNKRILELQLDEERKTQKGADPRTLLYLMKIYSERDDEEDWKKVIPMGDEYLEKSGWDEERATCWEQMAIVHGKLGDDRKAVACLHAAIEEWPHQPLLYIRLALAYFNIQNYKASKHWLDLAAQMDIDRKFTSGMTNIKAMKVMFAQCLLKLNYNANRDTKKALEAARLLAQEQPIKENIETLQFLEDLDQLNEACLHTDKLAHYLDSIGAQDAILPLINTLPEAIRNQPFAHKIRQRFTVPRKWADNEICYFANFGGKHFEQWDASSLETGIGGSETAVIRLAQEWTKLGYKVTVYGDPKKQGIDEFGINWLPWFMFNKNDFFNIFIQWRGWFLADKIKCRKFLIDLHDIFSPVDLKPEEVQAVDKFMVKSNYHRMLAPSVIDSKWEVISNGI